MFKPRKKNTRMEIRLIKNTEIEEFMENSGIEILDYHSRNKRYRINLKYGDVQKHKGALSKLFRTSLGIEDEEKSGQL